MALQMFSNENSARGAHRIELNVREKLLQPEILCVVLTTPETESDPIELAFRFSSMERKKPKTSHRMMRHDIYGKCSIETPAFPAQEFPVSYSWVH